MEEVRAVARLPCLAQPGRPEVPVRTDVLGDCAEVAPEILDRRPAPVPVAVVNAVNDEPGLEHERVRHHRVVVGIGVLLDVEIFWILRPASDRKVQVAPTEARNSRVTAMLSVEIVTMRV